MGSAMCLPSRDRGHEVRLVGTHLDRDIIDSVTATGRHPKLNVNLPDGVLGFHHEAFAMALGTDTDLIVLGVSSAGMQWAIDRLCETLKTPVPIVMITKGMYPEAARLTALPDHVASEVKRRTGLDLAIAAIGGPCIAGELAVRRHTGTVITSRDVGLGSAPLRHAGDRLLSPARLGRRDRRRDLRRLQEFLCHLRSAGPPAILRRWRPPKTAPSITMPPPSSSIRPSAN